MVVVVGRVGWEAERKKRGKRRKKKGEGGG
jgi:hypothetical protein